jgi:hypothetical protein
MPLLPSIESTAKATPSGSRPLLPRPGDLRPRRWNGDRRPAGHPSRAPEDTH